MRFRMATLAVALIGFLAINYAGNQYGQRLILEQINTPGEVGQGLSVEDTRLESELEVLSRMNAMIGTVDALGYGTAAAAEIRRDYRASVDHLERIRISYFLSQTIWRQTLWNLIWGVVVVLFFLPLALLLDQRYPVGPIRTDERGGDSGSASPLSEQEASRPA